MTMTIQKKNQNKALSGEESPLFVGQSTAGPGAAGSGRGDFVECLLDLICTVKPMTPDERNAASKAVRRHYGAEKHYIAARGPDADSAALASEVLAHFNGRNAREVARKLNIGKTTVYRKIKQAGRR